MIPLLLIACGSSDKKNTGTTVRRGPSLPTSTPRPTPLATVAATAVPLGDAQRPVVLLVAVPEGNPSSDVEQGGRALQNYLQAELAEELGREFALEVRYVSESDALNALCNGLNGSPAAAWTNAFTMHAANQQCGAVPVLALQRNEMVGQTLEIVSRTSINALTGLTGRRWCRLSADDFTSWIMPSLILSSKGVDPFAGFSSIIEEYPDSDADNLAMLKAIYNNDCDAAAFPPGSFEDLVDRLARDEDDSVSQVRRSLKLLVEAAVGDSLTEDYIIPYETLVFPSDAMIPLALRLTITEQVKEFFEDDDTGADRLLSLFQRDDLPDATGIMDVVLEDYAAFQVLVGKQTIVD
ncbi:MAG TPA: PhnD/SsuA/transferrin family substrate-binding protein [Aggregatilineaceae bacterium]|nr:PhnD/SsuA/transferrin family substrate-binding protein [Aggregatilineaceae bacterium]